MKVTNYAEAIRFLEGFIGKIIFKVDKEFVKKHDPLERMRILLSLLGDPQEKFKSVLVGGTSGKGSTAYLISHILTTAGYKTGFTLSPHLEKVNERLQINGKEISDKEFTKLTASMIRIIEAMKKMPIGAPSYFEILIAMAFMYFAEEKVDIVVVEVGMGGEFDATNTLYPLISVLTNVSLDHTNVLGKTVEKISRTKAGIIKSARFAHENFLVRSSQMNISKELKMRTGENFVSSARLVVISGVKQPSVMKIVENRCKKVGAELFRLGKDFNYKIKKESIKGSIFDLILPHDRGQILNNLCLNLVGNYQVQNASLAIETVRQLANFGFKVKEKDIREALRTAFFPGRFEILQCHPEFIRLGEQVQHDKRTTLILDGAHNPTKMKEFLKNLKKLFPKERKVFIIGFKFDKEIKKMLKEILSVADEVIVTEFKGKTDVAVHASASAFKVAKEIKKLSNKIIKVEKDSKKALQKALNYPITQLPNYQSIIVVTGSLYLVGEIRSML